MRSLLELCWVMRVLLWSVLREPWASRAPSDERSERHRLCRSLGLGGWDRRRSWRRRFRRSTLPHEFPKRIILIPLPVGG